MVFSRNTQGFTLIELSIVLVIIGLVVGGVLIGQDLIKASTIRSQISQIEKYNTAVHAFKLKYDGLPGDLAASKAATFGFVTRDGSNGRGNGNGVFDLPFSASVVTVPNCTYETDMFWNDLSTASMVDGIYSGADYPTEVFPLEHAASEIPNLYPAAKLGRGNYIVVGTMNPAYASTLYTGNPNHFYIGGIVSVSDASAAYELTMGITPIEAFNMDSKMDDGLPIEGKVQAGGQAGTFSSQPITAPSGMNVTSGADGNCIIDPNSYYFDGSVYNINEATGGNTPACGLRFHFQ